MCSHVFTIRRQESMHDPNANTVSLLLVALPVIGRSLAGSAPVAFFDRLGDGVQPSLGLLAG